MKEHTEAMYVRDVMSREVRTIERNDKLLAADQLIETERVRHLPVVDEQGMVVGILSQRDLFHSGLLRAIGYGTHGRERLLEGLPVKEVMTTEVVTTTADTRIADAAKLMVDRKIGCLPVVEGRTLVGIVTETDFVALAQRR